MTRRHPVVAAILLAAAFLAAGHRLWFSREVVVSVGLRAPRDVLCQISYTDNVGAKFSPDRAVTFAARPRGRLVRVALPVRRLEGLRFDFRVAQGTTVRVGPVTVTGHETRILDWSAFSVRHDIGRFEVDSRGAVNVEAVGGNPYAIHAEPLGIRSKVRFNAFALAVLILLAVLSWVALAALPAAWRRFAMSPQKERIRTAAFLLAAALLVAARFALVARIPPWFGPSSWDDGWFANAACSLKNGQWLGAYDEHTLIKGCFGPMVAAASSMLGVPFLVSQSILYAAVCLFSLFIVSRFVRSRIFLLVILALLLFHPLSFSLPTWQRVYRNGMPLWQAPLVVGCLFLMFCSARRRFLGLAGWAFASGFAFWAFQNTREDGVWLWPIMLAFIVLSAIRAWKAGKSRRERVGRMMACLLPLAVLLLGNEALCLVNGRIYGVPIRNDRDAGCYAKAMRDLYLIEPDPEDEARLSSPEHAGHYHNIYYSTLCKAYEASPTLDGARDEIDAMIDAWAKVNHYSGRDLRLDHVLFAIRLGVSRAGHYRSLRDSEAFFGQVHRELEASFSNGTLRRRGISVTAMVAPFRPEFIPRVLREWWHAIVFVAHLPCPGPKAVFPGDPSLLSADLKDVPAFREASASVQPTEETRPVVESAVRRANAVAKGCSSLFPGLSVAALAGYVILSVIILFRRQHPIVVFDGWLLATGILGSILAHTACIAYVGATTFGATSPHYLAASYQLLLLFVAIVAGMSLSAAGFGGVKEKEPNP